jgi:hypothetical protein
MIFFSMPEFIEGRENGLLMCWCAGVLMDLKICPSTGSGASFENDILPDA